MNNQEDKQGESETEPRENVWTDGTLDEIEYMKFELKNQWTVKCKFMENDPTAHQNKFGSPSFDFEVLDLDTETLKCLSITSKRLMRALSDFRPLVGLDLCIERTGAEMDIDYTVTVV